MPARLDFLDGIRGLSALWVLLAHCMMWGGWYWHYFPDPKIAVDLFMFVSGYLMVYQWDRRRAPVSKVNWPTVGEFLLRRFFRLAPVYYLVLVAMFLLQPALTEGISLLRTANPARWAHDVIYDPHLGQLDVLNFFLRSTFLVGFVPSRLTASFIGDWSLMLEMQFYVAFPFLLSFVRRRGFAPSGWIILGLALCTAWIFRRLPEFRPGAGVFLGEPAFLLLKLPLFFIGMAIAEANRLFPLSAEKSVLLFAHAMVIALFQSPWVGAVAALSYTLALPPSSIPGAAGDSALRMFARFLGHRTMGFLADCSYPVYLLHSFAIALWGGWLFRQKEFLAQPPVQRVALLAACVIPTSYGLAWLCHRLVEQPGIAVGRKLTQRVFPPRIP